MKTNIKTSSHFPKFALRTLLLLLAFMSATTTLAADHDFEVDGIYYYKYKKYSNSNSYEVAVTFKGNTYSSYSNEYTGNVIIPSTVSYNGVNYNVTAIMGNAFRGCSELTSVTIPNSITVIGSDAFLGTAWYNNQPDGLVYAGLVAYKYKGTMPSGTSLNIKEGTLGIAGSAFLDCIGLSNITMPNSVTHIEGSAFEGCSALTNITIPNSVIKIGLSAFSGCSELASISIPNSVTFIGTDAFLGTAWYNNQPDGLVYAGFVAYKYKGSIPEYTNIIIREGTVGIAPAAFRDCSNLISVTVPSSVTFIGNLAFQGCSDLETLNFNAVSCEDFGNVVQSLPFYDLNISTINIGNNVEKIPACFVYGMSGLMNLRIPGSVTSIGQASFSKCSGLTNVYCDIKEPTEVTMGNNTFYLANKDYSGRTLRVPKGTLAAYQTDSRWSQFFGNIVDTEPYLVESISLDQTTAVMHLQGTLQLKANVLPEGATNKTVTWASSNHEVVTVNENGLVTAVAVGSATVTATTTDGSDLSASCVVTVTEDLSDYDNYLSLEDMEVIHGKTIIIPVSLENESELSAFQTDLYLPEGFELVKEDGDYLVELSDRKGRDHVIMANDLDDGGIRILSYSTTVKPYSGNEGELFYITIKTPDDGDGDYTIMLKNTLLTTTDHEELNAPDASCTVTVYPYIMGDANNSGTVTVTDIVATARHILNYHPAPFVIGAADMNYDGSITVTDIVMIAQLIMDGAPVTYPYRAPAKCGTLDRMSGAVVNADGTRRTISITLDNAADYTAFQLDLLLPKGMVAENFTLSDGSGSHTLEANQLDNGKTRLLCYTPMLKALNGDAGSLLTFDVIAEAGAFRDIAVDGIEMVTTDCQTAALDAFIIKMDNLTSVDELSNSNTVAKVEYFNLSGQQIEEPNGGVTIVVTTYTNGSRVVSKIIR